jgi:hypothetical protein
MDDITKIKADLNGAGRVETGPLQINDDWTGCFIRGDNALGYAIALNTILEALTEDQKNDLIFRIAEIEELTQLLAKVRQ